MEQPVERPFTVLQRLIYGYRVSQAIHVAAELGIPDLLEDGPPPSDDLATATGAHAATLHRLLYALASIGVLKAADDGRFALTALGDCPRSNAVESLAPAARFIGRAYAWQAWGGLLHSVQTGENANQHLLGMSAWEYRARHPEEGAVFDAWMASNSRRQTAALLAAYAFGRYGCIADVGGGQRTFLAAILANHPAMQGILFDQPHVVASAEPALRTAGVMGRCRIVGGSFFDAVPEGADAYLLKFILHDWDDPQAVTILGTCRRAMGKTGTLLVIDRVLGPPAEGADPGLSDLNMLVLPGGRERTRAEWAALLESAEFRLVGVTATASEVSVIEGVPT